MTNRNKFFFISAIGFILLFAGESSTAQKTFLYKSPKYSFVKHSFPQVLNYLSITPDTNKKPAFSISPPAAFCNVAFFCRQEIKLEKAIKVPVKFRLGSLDQANYYEGKR